MALNPDPPRLPVAWSDGQIVADARAAREEFRQRRMAGPLEDYEREFPVAKAAADVVVAELEALLALPANREMLAAAVANKAQYSALRSLAAVPISEDDLRTLVDATVTRTAVRANQQLADDLVRLLRASLDPKRFPWIAAGRPATDEERAAAQLATAVLAGVSAVQAGRRGLESNSLEGRIAGLLQAAGYLQVKKPAGGIKHMAHLPQPGQFVRTCRFGTHNADFVVRLRDERILALECKASNSEVNGFKRLNKEVVVDAGDWYRQFGHSSVIAAAALRGVFKPANVMAAQAEGVFLFWWHRMDDLADFVAASPFG